MKIVVLHRPKSACDYHRVYNPFRYLPVEDGDRVVYITDDQIVRVTDLKDANLVVFNRHPTVDLDSLIDLRKQYKFKIWCDIDDDWELYGHHHLYESWKKAGMDKIILQSIGAADIVTTTNRRLLRKIKLINEKCKVIPNALPIDHEQFTSLKTESTRLRFMYVGGPSHYSDLMSIKPFFDEIALDKKFIEESKFCMAGYRLDYKESALHKMNDIMKVSPNYSTRPALDLNNYMSHYNHTDIALSPLENNTFNYYKSNLKIIEAGCMRTPIIVSDMYPFLEDQCMINNGVFFCKNSKEWFGVANDLLTSPHTIPRMAENLYDYVTQNYDLIKVNKLRKDIINSFK